MSKTGLAYFMFHFLGFLFVFIIKTHCQPTASLVYKRVVQKYLLLFFSILSNAQVLMEELISHRYSTDSLLPVLAVLSVLLSVLFIIVAIFKSLTALCRSFTYLCTEQTPIYSIRRPTPGFFPGFCLV